MQLTDDSQLTIAAKGDSTAECQHASDVRASLRRLQELVATRIAKRLVAEQRSCPPSAGLDGLKVSV
jgi:hypothetical protein